MKFCLTNKMRKRQSHSIVAISHSLVGVSVSNCILELFLRGDILTQFPLQPRKYPIKETIASPKTVP